MKHLTTILVVAQIACAVAFAYMCSRAHEDVAWTVWIAGASRSEVWLFIWSAVLTGVWVGRVGTGSRG